MVQCFSFGVCLAAWAQAFLRFRVSLLRAAYARSLSNQLLSPTYSTFHASLCILNHYCRRFDRGRLGVWDARIGLSQGQGYGYVGPM